MGFRFIRSLLCLLLCSKISASSEKREGGCWSRQCTYPHLHTHTIYCHMASSYIKIRQKSKNRYKSMGFRFIRSLLCLLLCSKISASSEKREGGCWSRQCTYPHLHTHTIYCHMASSYTYTCVYIYMYVCMYIYTHVYICTHTYTCVCIYTHTHTHTHIHVLYIYKVYI